MASYSDSFGLPLRLLSLWLSFGLVISAKLWTLNYADQNSPPEVPACAFDESLQGTFRTQNSQQIFSVNEYGMREPMTYQEVYIGPSSIPLWGDCVERRQSTYILGIKEVGGQTCYRCFVIIQRTPNVLQVLLNEHVCHGSIAMASRSCFDASIIQPNEGTFLYRSQNVINQYCPLEGRANLSYVFGNRIHCPFSAQSPSTISNCKYGYQLDVSLRSCSFPAYDISFHCLGTWPADNNNDETYFAVYNLELDEYRCGLFSRSNKNGYSAVAALSNDSSCTNVLTNSSYGYERFEFFQNSEQNESAKWISTARSECVFPEWIGGRWSTMEVGRDSIDFYADNRLESMHRMQGKCAEVRLDRLAVTTMTRCDDRSRTTCLWFANRGPAVMEVKIATPKNDGKESCFQDNTYTASSWSAVLPASQIPINKQVVCPFLGNFSTEKQYRKKGRDCYNITTTCDQPNRFTLTTYLCETDRVYDEQEFFCLATWPEDSFQFTYTNRTETGIKGCFVHRRIENRLYIAWTDDLCRRDVDFDGWMGVDHYENPIATLEETDICSSINSVSRPFAGDRYSPVNPKLIDTDIPDPTSYSIRPRCCDSYMIIMIFLLIYCTTIR